MRLIDADVLEKTIEQAIAMQEGIIKFLCAEDDEGLQAELKAYKDILNGVKESPTIQNDMKQNPECEDCRPEDVRECQFCRQR